MIRFRTILTFALLAPCALNAQTAASLYLKSDKVQVQEIGADAPVPYKKVGHHGPAVENSHMALRIYYNDSGAVDLYSKSGRAMELRKYLWYPTERQQAEEGAGCDEYLAGKTVGFGGLALWDGENEIRPVATSGRIARVGETRRGSFAEVVYKGVAYEGRTVDLSLRLDVKDGSRYAKVTLSSLSGDKVRFATGINYHPGEDLRYGRGWLCVWGVHPADVSKNPSPVGAAMRFKPSFFTPVEQTPNTLRIVTRKPVKKACTMIIGASTKEEQLSTPDALAAEVSSGKSF